VGRYVNTNTIWTKHAATSAARKLPCDSVMTGWRRWYRIEAKHIMANAPHTTLTTMR
jgi:hypothetical protein